MIPAAVPHPRLTLAHRFTRDKQIWVGRAVGFLQCADGAMSFGLRDCIAGGIGDQSSIALSTGRMRQDTTFREAVHQYLREFDRVFCQFEQAATDEDIVKLSATRSARAFMLLGRVTGIFD